MLTVKPTKNCRTKKDNDKKKLKVVYISSPMKVKTSASRFRSLVQELTGRDSDITRYINAAGCFDSAAPTTSTPLDGRFNSKRPVEFTQQDLLTGSESSLLADHNVFSSEMFDQLDEILPSCSLHLPSAVQFDH